MTNVTPGLLVLTISVLIYLFHAVQSNHISSDKAPQVVKNAIPKHIKAMYKADRAIYAKDFAYKMMSIPTEPAAPGDATTSAGPESRSSRVGRQAWNTHYLKVTPTRLRKRKVRHPPVRMTYTMPALYAAKYKTYALTYKKRPRYAPPRVVASSRYPPKHRMPLHNNVIEPMEEYEDEEVMEEEPVVMETMGPSYSAPPMPIMRPAHNDEIYMSDYDSMRMPSRPVEYVTDEDYNMMRHSDYHSGGSPGGYSSGMRSRSPQTRAVKPVSVMYSSSYRDLRNTDSRFEPEVIAHRPIKQMDFASSTHFESSPPMYISDPELKYRPYQNEPQPKYRSYNSEPDPRYRSSIDDSDFLSSNLRVKSELPDFMRSDNTQETQESGVRFFSPQQPTAQTTVDNSKWAGSLKFMPRPFASTLDSESNYIRNSGTKMNQDSSSGSDYNNANYKAVYEAPSSHTKQSALTIHDLLLQQAKQIQDNQSASQGRDLGSNYSHINDFLVYNGPSSTQRFRSNEDSNISRRSSGSDNVNQFYRYSRPQTPEMHDMDPVLDSLPWKVKKKDS